MNKLGSKVLFACTVGGWLATGCSSGAELSEASSQESGDPHASAPEVVETVEAPTESAKLRIERALRELDRGGDAKAVKADLDLLLAQALDRTDRAEARLARSRAFEALGDEEGAIEEVEAILVDQAHADRTPAREAAEKRLRFLLTGSETERFAALPANTQLAPITHALAELFPESDEGALVDVWVFGQPRGDNHGIFQIVEAKRQKLEQELRPRISMGSSISGAGSWVGLPRAMGEHAADMPQADRSLLVFYFDLADLRVPSRYDDYLPMPSDEIVEILERGDGLVVAKKRASGKPTIVIAAPRNAQLAAVEEAFSKMTSVPYEPVTVELDKKLLPAEIQATIRTARSQMRGCYEQALKRDKKLTGTILLDLVIEPDGSLSRNAIGDKSTLRDKGLESCLSAAMAELSFPASHGDKVTVSYPLLMTP